MSANVAELNSIARAMVAKGKGILAADESSGTIKRRLESVKVESTDDNRRAYRELLFTTPGIEEFISGIILYDETIRQSAKSGKPFSELLSSKGIIPGIKVDKGPVNLPFFPGEVVTEGLDGLRQRFAEYHKMGARFAKWRAVIAIGPGIPTEGCITANAEALARYAALSQEAGLVPIVEPEVLIDGDHTIERCDEATTATLKIVFSKLSDYRVAFEGMILKPNMVLSGKDCPVQASVQEVAERTINCFKRTVPAAVPGVAFLSGGQSAELATERLNAMNAMGPHPWEVSFSYSRALQDPVLKTWKGDAANAEKAQKVFYHRAKLNSLARQGKYNKEMEKAAA
jgi:fructose-bisphosphate aldolase class I